MQATEDEEEVLEDVEAAVSYGKLAVELSFISISFLGGPRGGRGGPGRGRGRR